MNSATYLWALMTSLGKHSSYCAVRHGSDVSKNRFDLDITTRQTFGHASDANVRVKINGCNTVCDFNFYHHVILTSNWQICVNIGRAC